MEEMYNLVKDFSHKAEEFSKLIIDELNLPDELKTIKVDPSIGGEAGGIKYIHHGMMVSILLLFL